MALSKKDRQQLMVIGVGLVLLAIVLPGSFKKKKNPPRPAPAAVAPASAASDPAPAVRVGAGAFAAAQAQRWELPWGRDPFSSQADERTMVSEFKLKGISFRSDKKGYAFINDDIVTDGDKIGGFDVVMVEKDRVLLRRGTQNFYLTFPKEE
jgi:hypothetical protein